MTEEIQADEVEIVIFETVNGGEVRDEDNKNKLLKSQSGDVVEGFIQEEVDFHGNDIGVVR